MRRLLGLLTAAVTLAGIGLAWRGHPSAPVLSLPQGTFFTVATERNHCEFELAFEPGSRYLLIVGNLADASLSHHVRCDSVPVSEIRHTPFTRIEPWPINKTRRVPSQPSARTPPAEPSGSDAHVEASHIPAPATSRSSHSAGNGRRSDGDSRSRRSPAASAGVTAGKPAVPHQRRVFYLHVTDGPLEDPRQYVRVDATLVTRGKRVRVYLDEQLRAAELDAELPSTIVETLENQIMPTYAEWLGRCPDVDGDGTLAVLLTPWLDRLQGGRTSLGGFVKSCDFRPEFTAPLSNRGDILYLNARLRCGPHLTTILAHEFAHAVAIGQRLCGTNSSLSIPDEQDWLSEAIAHLAEARFGQSWSNLDHRVSRYLDAPQAFPLVVPDYYRAGMWRNHGCRGATYLFLRWCAGCFGDDLPRRLVHSPLCGVANLECATGRRFDELFRQWSMALWLAGRRERSDSTTHSAVAPDRDDRRGLQCRADERGLRLCGRMGRWLLTGPSCESWEIAEEGPAFDLRGTACAFITVSAGGCSGARRIRIQAEQGSRLQVTIARIENDTLFRIIAAAEGIAPNSRSAENSGPPVETLASAGHPGSSRPLDPPRSPFPGTPGRRRTAKVTTEAGPASLVKGPQAAGKRTSPAIGIQIMHPQGEAFRIRAIALEYGSAGRRASHIWSGNRLEEASAGAGTNGRDGTVDCLRLRLPNTEDVGSEVTVRAVIVDAEGRPWALATKVPIPQGGDSQRSTHVAAGNSANRTRLAVEPSFDR